MRTGLRGAPWLRLASMLVLLGGGAAHAQPSDPSTAAPPSMDATPTEPTAPPEAEAPVDERPEAIDGGEAAGDPGTEIVPGADAAGATADPGEDGATNDDARLLAELGLDADADPASDDADDRFRIYGFLDLGANALYFPRGSLISDVVPYQAPSFVLGNLNLYFDARPSPDWHALAEIRFTAYPHGTPAIDGTTFTTVSTRVPDVTSSTGRNLVNWGGIVLERAYVEWTRFDAFRVRAGLFLTPYGIWNVDHGTPTLLGLILPTFIADEYLPLRQTGLEFDGHVQLERGDLEYSLYVSNGRPQGLFDVDLDKAIGGRVRYTTGTSTRITVGGSFYVGDSETQEKVLTIGMDGVRYRTDTLVSYRDYALAADLSIDTERFGLRSELVMRSITYDPDARAPVTFGPPGRFEPDSRDYSWYVAPFVRHRRLTPYVWYEYTRGNLGATNNTRMLFSAGLNVDFTPSVQLKTQLGYYAFYLWDDDVRRADVGSNFYLATTRIAMAF